MTFELPPEVAYIGLLFGLFVVPRILQRWRVPAAITSFGLGALAGPGLGIFEQDTTIKLLSTLGIVALFLFAGLEVSVRDLRRESKVIGEHLVIRLVGLALVAAAASSWLGLEVRAAILVSLALLTPSTGFILDSLPALGLSPETVFWVRTKAIATELVALLAMFLTLQTVTLTGFLLSSAALIAMIVGLPWLFRVFARFIVPHAPKTEFAFLLMTSVVCALVTKQLGVYYLVGAFIVGVVAQRFRTQLPAMASEKMLDAIEAFASIFVPFYFFHAGLVLRRGDFSLGSLGFAGIFLLIGVPLGLFMVVLHRHLRLRESIREGVRVGGPMLPTLVFTLVIAQILRDRFGASPAVFGGLVIYALVNTVIPSFLFRTPALEFETPEAPELDEAAKAIASLDPGPTIRPRSSR